MVSRGYQLAPHDILLALQRVSDDYASLFPWITLKKVLGVAQSI
jgi:hypothetical protein